MVVESNYLGEATFMSALLVQRDCCLVSRHVPFGGPAATGQAEGMSPPELRDRIRTLAGKLLERHG